MSVLLEVKALRAGYGRVPVLHGVDFEVAEGEIVGVLGHNGMGKTTLLKAIMGIVPAAGGVIGYAGLDLTRARASERARNGIGYVPQGRGIFPNLSVRDNIRMGIAAHHDDDEDTQHDPRWRGVRGKGVRRPPRDPLRGRGTDAATETP